MKRLLVSVAMTGLALQPLAAQDAPTQEEQAAISLALKRGEGGGV